MIAGDNSILKKAGDTKEVVLKAQDQEELQLAIIGLKSDNYQNTKEPFVDFLLNCEEYLQSKLNSKELQIDKECKKIIYKGNIYSLSDDGRLILEDKGIALNKNHIDLQIIGVTR